MISLHVAVPFPMPHPISDKVEGRGEGPAGGGEVQVQDGRADHEVGDGGDAGEGGHSPVDAAAWTEEREIKTWSVLIVIGLGKIWECQKPCPRDHILAPLQCRLPPPQ